MIIRKQRPNGSSDPFSLVVKERIRRQISIYKL